MTDSAFTPCVVYITAPDEATATRLADQLVEQRLAACVNIVARVTSVYRWQGRIERDEEQLLIAKTHRARVAAINACLAEAHPDDVPECIAVDISDGSPAYLEWLAAETRSA